LIASPVFGPHAQLVADALGTLTIPVRVLSSAEELELELLVKNVYILTTNIAGLETGGTVSELWSQHEPVARAVVEEVIAIQASLVDHGLDSDKLIQGMLADGAAGLRAPRLREIHAQA